MSGKNGFDEYDGDELAVIEQMADQAILVSRNGNSAAGNYEPVAAPDAEQSDEKALPLDELIQLIDSLDQVERVNGIVSNTASVSKFSAAERIVFFSKFDEWGFAPNVQKDLRGHIAKACKKTGSITSDIRRDLRKWGYDLWLNDMDDDIYDGSKRLDDPAMAKLTMTARDAGYAESRKLSALDDAVLAIAAENRRHPIREYLSNLEWDGKDHIAKLATYFEENHEPIVYKDGTRRTVFEAFLRRWLVGSVAKMHEDSDAAKGNFVLTMAGDQGSGKSHFAQWLCPLNGFYDEKRIYPDNKDHSLSRARTWVWEIGELGATTRRADVEALKGFLTTPVVRERKSYGHADTVKPAISSYIGTVNPDGAGFLVDTTGNRRFAVVEIASINWAYAKEVDIHQVWAQAMHLWKSDSRGYRLSEEENKVQVQNAEAHMEVDVVGDMIARLYEIDPARDDWRATSSEILDKLRTFGGMARNSDKQQGKEIARSLRTMGIIGKRSNSSTVYSGLYFKGIL